MIGERMTTAEAKRLLGGSIAFVTQGGQWVAGSLVGVADQPQAIVQHDDGTIAHYTISTITSWAAPDPPVRATPDVARAGFESTPTPATSPPLAAVPAPEPSSPSPPRSEPDVAPSESGRSSSGKGDRSV